MMNNKEVNQVQQDNQENQENEESDYLETYFRDLQKKRTKISNELFQQIKAENLEGMKKYMDINPTYDIDDYIFCAILSENDYYLRQTDLLAQDDMYSLRVSKFILLEKLREFSFGHSESDNIKPILSKYISNDSDNENHDDNYLQDQQIQQTQIKLNFDDLTLYQQNKP